MRFHNCNLNFNFSQVFNVRLQFAKLITDRVYVAGELGERLNLFDEPLYKEDVSRKEESA